MATKNWVIDPTHSEIHFKVKHLMITNVTGSFNSYSGTVQTEEDDFSKAVIRFEADANSIDTGNEQRDGHLQSGDFFDAAQFPKLNFASTQIEKSGDDGIFSVTGDLTIKGVTQSVVLTAEFAGIVKDPYGNTKAGFTINTKIQRKDFGLTWNAATETGGIVVSDEVKIICEVQLVQQA